MVNKYLARQETPFGAEIWEALDAAMQVAAKSHLVGRRLLDVEGPFGLGLKTVPLGDGETGSGLVASKVLPVVFIQKSFTLGTRDLANYDREAVALDMFPVEETAVLGQDMMIGYIGPAGAEQEFSISESLTLHIRQPKAICILKEGKGP